MYADTFTREKSFRRISGVRSAGREAFEEMKEDKEDTKAAKNAYAGTKTEKNLWEAFAGESEARNKYTFFASVAQKQGYEQIAALFLRTAENERARKALVQGPGRGR